MWTECADEPVFAAAMACARGRYQRALLQGEHNLSGSTLKGKAARYGAQYARSRAGLIRRLHQAGIDAGERRGEHGRRILVLSWLPSRAAA